MPARVQKLDGRVGYSSRKRFEKGNLMFFKKFETFEVEVWLKSVLKHIQGTKRIVCRHYRAVCNIWNTQNVSRQ